MILSVLACGCAGDDISRLSIMNDTGISIYALPYASDFTDGDWIAPGTFVDFYSISHESLDAYAFFTLYYDSVIIYLEDHDLYPVKFYQDGSTVNYDATRNPFTNPDVWDQRKFKSYISGSPINSMEEKRIFEHFFAIERKYVKILSDSVLHELNPAP